MTTQRKIKMKVLYKGRLLGIIETTPKNQPNRISTVKQFNDEEEEQQDVIIKKVTSSTMKKVTTSTMKKVSSSTMKKNTISSHKRIEKVQQRLKERNRSWRRKRIIYT